MKMEVWNTRTVSRYSTDQTPGGEGGNNIIGNRRDALKKKSSLKSLDGSSTRRMGANTSVRFSSVDVRDYSLCPGDNPSVSRGIPVSLDWEYDEEQSYDINKYEHGRLGHRRDFEELKLPSLQRIQLLKNLGYSRGEINEQVKKVQEVKDKRLITRRRAERRDRVKELSRGMLKAFGCVIPISNSKESKLLSCADKTKQYETCVLIESEDVTLSSSTSSKKSDISETEFHGNFVPTIIIQDRQN